ncbi:MAG TPA: DUF4114 domain-containing protein [Chryseosolibacter sp.]
MKARIICIVLLAASIACKDDDVFVEVTPVPEDIFHIDLCPTLVDNAVSLFPEAHNNQDRYSQLFSDASQQRIVLTKDTDVYVSFVTEAATIGNVLGYYIYTNSTPGSSDDIDKQLVFPNIDNVYLKPGDTRRLGSAPLKSGTVIGFYLIVDGYRNDGVYFKKPTFYTDPAWNADGAKQHVMYQESECSAIVVGFEDKNSTIADKDYNDIIFTVSDNTQNAANTSFDLQSVVSLTN